MTDKPLEIYEFAYEKYGQHTVALRTGGMGVELFDAVKLFSKNNSLKEYERVKDEAAAFAKKFVAQFNGEYIGFKAGDTHCEDCPCRYGQHISKGYKS